MERSHFDDARETIMNLVSDYQHVDKNQAAPPDRRQQQQHATPDHDPRIRCQDDNNNNPIKWPSMLFQPSAGLLQHAWSMPRPLI